MENQTNDIRDAVRQNYSKVAEKYPVFSGCGCAPNSTLTFNQISSKLGYSKEELNNVPEGSNMGLGCGNPQAIAALKKGETVLDLGSGAGFDVFLAANQVGEKGKVIGVDMTPKMITKAKINAVKGNYSNVEFRLGEIENLPVKDKVIDVIISNCVINLSPEKQKVFNDAFRVLKTGGRLAVSDIVTTTELPEEIKYDMDLYSGCVSGASTIDEIEIMLKTAGFVDIEIKPKDESKKFIREWAPGTNISDYIISATIEAIKPQVKPK
jgi:ubiquinone/menaquinone biosynthesis C-methylase UbiE